MVNQKDNNYFVVLCTVPDSEAADKLAQLALDSGLAACLTAIPQAVSYYYWQGKLERQSEIQLLVKTDCRHLDALLVLLRQHHPYQTPELLALPVVAGDNEYLSWLSESLN